MQELAIIEYVGENRFKLYQKKGLLEYWSLERIIERVQEDATALIVFVVPFYISINQTKQLLEKVASVEGVMVSRPSILCLYTFGGENIFYININIVDKDDVCTADCGSIIQDVCHIEAEEIKKTVISDKHNVECYIEVVRDNFLCHELCKKFEGYLDSVVSEIYNMLSGSFDEKRLANHMCVESRSIQLKKTFKDRFAMAMCTNEGDSLRKTTFLEVPDFVKDISFVWDAVENLPACVGILKAINTVESFSKLFIPSKDLCKLSGEDIYLTSKIKEK